jgi:branched-chain amino acid transport system substrate-binding protein
MKCIGKSVFILVCVFSLLSLTVCDPSSVFAAKAEKKAKVAKVEKLTEVQKAVDAQGAVPGSMAEKYPKPDDAFDVAKMSDMSDYDPAHWVSPTGDTIKIAMVQPFSGPGALNGWIFLHPLQYAAHDINKRGGIWVDGKKKLIEVIQADSMSKPDQAKKVCERMVLQEKVQILMGTSGSNIQKIINEVANKYKVLAVNEGSLSDDLMDATNFGRYSFMTSPDTSQIGRGLAYFFGQIRKKEKKFYILCQDYSFGRSMAETFKQGLKDFYPEAQIVGEDYHKLFLTDFAPYLEKIKASGAEVIYTGDWIPDAGNLLKQARQMGVMLPFANLFVNEPNNLNEVGVEGTKGLLHIDIYNAPMPFKFWPPAVKSYTTYNNLWRTKWKTPPYNTNLFQHGGGLYGDVPYWLFSVLERAKSMDPEKIIKVWEGDTYRFPNGKIVKMRACDHKMISDLVVEEYVPPAEQKVSMSIPPYHWFTGASAAGPAWLIPAGRNLPWMDQKLERCTGKNGWGE